MIGALLANKGILHLSSVAKYTAVDSAIITTLFSIMSDGILNFNIFRGL